MSKKFSIFKLDCPYNSDNIEKNEIEKEILEYGKKKEEINIQREELKKKINKLDKEEEKPKTSAKPIKLKSLSNELKKHKKPKKVDYDELMLNLLIERREIQERINNMDKEEIKEDPQKIDSVLENIFKDFIKKYKNDKIIKENIQKDFEIFQKQLIEDFRIFKNKQRVYLEKLQDKHFIINRKKDNINYLNENAEIISEPLYKGENAKNIFSQLPQNKYNLVINSAGDTKNELINNKDSKFYKNKLCENIIQCMNGQKGPIFNAPNKKFLEVKDCKMEGERFNDKLDFNLKRYKDKLAKESEQNIIDNQKKTVDIQNKIFEQKYNEYLSEINKYLTKEENNLKILDDIKEQMNKDNLYERLIQTKLNISKKSKEKAIDNITNKTNQDYGTLRLNMDNDNSNYLKEKYLKEIDEANLKYDDAIKKIDKNLKNVRDKYKNKMKEFNNKKRNKSINYINNRKYYNDNPYHYKYNYDGASIPIKKILKRYD